MKNIFTKILFVCTLLVLTTTIDAYCTKITINLTWGKKSKDCRGFGICKFDLSVTSDDFLRLSDDNSTVILDVPFSAVKGYESFFNGPTISIEEQYDISADVQSALGSPKPLFIRPGKYKCEKTPTGYTIYFVQ